MHITENNILNKLTEISDCLARKDNELSRIGIKYGKSGIVLFYFMYYKFTGIRKYYHLGEQLLESIFSQINAGFSDGRIAEQYSDFGRLIELLNTQGLYNVSTNDILNSIDELQETHFEICKHINDYDITCGALCSGYYFISRLRSTPNAKYKLSEIILWLETIAIKQTEDIVYWKSKLFNDDRIYFGATHGTASIIIFLIKMYNMDILKKLSAELIRRALNHIIFYKKDISKSKSFFPVAINSSLNEILSSKERILLEWCYGDLGILYSFLLTAKALNDLTLYDQAVEMLLHYANKRNENNAVVDAGIAHGASGTHYLFYKFYKLTDNPIFKSSAHYWINQTFRYYNNLNSHNTLFYKSKYEVDIPPAGNIGFMSGLAGIGIQYMIHLNNDMDIIDELLYM